MEEGNTQQVYRMVAVMGHLVIHLPIEGRAEVLTNDDEKLNLLW